MRMATEPIDIKLPKMKSRVVISISPFTVLATLATSGWVPRIGGRRRAKHVTFDASVTGTGFGEGTFEFALNPLNFRRFRGGRYGRSD